MRYAENYYTITGEKRQKWMKYYRENFRPE